MKGRGGYINVIEDVIILFIIIIILFFSKLNKCFIVIFCHALCVLLYVSTPSWAGPPCHLDILQ